MQMMNEGIWQSNSRYSPPESSLCHHIMQWFFFPFRGVWQNNDFIQLKNTIQLIPPFHRIRIVRRSIQFHYPIAALPTNMSRAQNFNKKHIVHIFFS